jgi:hypothetical protein
MERKWLAFVLSKVNQGDILRIFNANQTHQ